MKSISEDIHLIIKKIFDTKHPFLAVILFQWKEIMGNEYSRLTIPVTVKQYKEKGMRVNILVVEVANSSLHLELSFRQDIILERLNFYLKGAIGGKLPASSKGVAILINKIKFVTTNK